MEARTTGTTGPHAGHRSLAPEAMEAHTNGRRPGTLADRANPLGEFLQVRRGRVGPEDVGLPDGGRRRVPGLRREELAQLAGVSVDYYVRLEQGRATHPSPEVLDALARVLLLDDVERRHLHDLVMRRGAPSPPECVRPALQRLLDRLDLVPAFVVDRRLGVLAWNRLAAALIADFGAMPPEQRNLARFMIPDPAARELYVDWERHARESVGILRRAAGLEPDDPRLAALVGELSLKSNEFARWWAAHEVSEKTHGTKRYRHPLVGELTGCYETLALPSDPGQSLITYTTAPGSESETALRLLAAWAAEPVAASGS
jgi:transcriptional regulator with XRE-family HTH domain